LVSQVISASTTHLERQLATGIEAVSLVERLFTEAGRRELLPVPAERFPFFHGMAARGAMAAQLAVVCLSSLRLASRVVVRHTGA
jgi:hypothetical protein